MYIGKPSEIEKYHWLNISIKLHNVKLMKELISKGVCVNFPAELPKDVEFSPLHNCVEYNLLEGIPLLVDAGADVDIHARDKHKPTPLHRAILAEDLKLPMVKELMFHGTNPYCLVEVVNPVSGKLLRWDCFELAKVLKNDEMMLYLNKYKVCWLCMHIVCVCVCVCVCMSYSVCMQYYNISYYTIFIIIYRRFMHCITYYVYYTVKPP